MNSTPHSNVNILELPEAGGTNDANNPLWVIDSSTPSIIEGDRFAGPEAGAVRIHQLLGRDLDQGMPHSPDAVEAAGLALIAAARAARAGTERSCPLCGEILPPSDDAVNEHYNAQHRGDGVCGWTDSTGTCEEHATDDFGYCTGHAADVNEQVST